MQKINKEKAALDKTISEWQNLHSRLEDAQVLLEMAAEAKDEASFDEVKSELRQIQLRTSDLEIKSLMRGPMDASNAYVSINSGAGGTEACDWAEMLMRMYLRWAERQGFRAEVLSMTPGEEAGIKSVTIFIEGPFVYGNLRSECGVHRLVRISPFDSNARRHTSFAALHAWPELDDEVQIEIKDEDLKVDTYRASGAGGQHVNRTDSAVRITHLPSGVVVQCQNERSQHSNRDRAMKMLKAALYEIEQERRNKELAQYVAEKKANEWGSQIRSYVLHPYQMVKDHRTDFESSNPQGVLDGELNPFVQAFLKEQALQGAAT